MISLGSELLSYINKYTVMVSYTLQEYHTLMLLYAVMVSYMITKQMYFITSRDKTNHSGVKKVTLIFFNPCSSILHGVKKITSVLYIWLVITFITPDL